MAPGFAGESAAPAGNPLIWDNQHVRRRPSLALTCRLRRSSVRVAIARAMAAKPTLVLLTTRRRDSIPVIATTRFMVLHEGRIYFEGSPEELRASRDAYLREFLFMTLPPW